MNEMRKLMEAVQLNEYLTRQGDSFDALLQLNVFQDLYGPNAAFMGEETSEWIDIVRDYSGHAKDLAREIKKYAKKGRTLTSFESAAADETWYDGSDAYSNGSKQGAEWLPEIYDRQLEQVEEILHGNIEGLHEAQLNEGWDVKGIAQVIYDEIKDEGSPIRKAFNGSNEPYRASIYEYGRLSGLYNPEALDGSEIYHKIVDELELLVAGPEERFMGEAYDDEVDGPNPFGTDAEVLKQLVRELQKLERDTARVYTEVIQSRKRPDFAEMAVNELGMTLTDITNLVEKYEDFN